MKLSYRILTIVLLTALVFSGLAGTYIYKTHLAPVTSVSTKITVEIKNGMTAKQIAKLLEHNKIIRSQKAFAWIARYSGKAEKLRAGEYELDSSQTPGQILRNLLDGKVVLHEVTVPEGLTISQIALLFSQAGFGEPSLFIQAAENSKLLGRFGIKGNNAEGYLMPETYRFPKSAAAAEIVTKMISTFMEKVEPLKLRYQQDSPLEFNKIITLASIIEKETGNRDEYRLISSVFHNRLKKGMMLQADPTVIYGLPDFDGNIRKSDLLYDSPYNTYRHRGLPPGPISNPGLPAIEAAYKPAETGYIYFVATKREGRHYFSSSLRDHNRAVAKYQLNKR
ncbi:MAG: endolytic transglycosylase MltG [Nitrospinota bacterium]